MQTKEQQSQWVAQAEQLKPRLRREDRLPTALVRTEGDASAFQGWTTRPTGEALATLFDRAMGKGDDFVLDFGEHIVGYLRFSLEVVGPAMDAPVRLKLIFGEVPAEIAEPFDPYPGQLSRAWLQDEVITIDVLPGTIQLPRRYAFRYLKVVVIDTSPVFRVRFTDIRCETVTSADESQAPPLADDMPDDVRKLDEVSLRTLRNCMQTVFEDGPKRDRRLWIGDLRLQAMTNYLTFRNYDLVKRCLYLFAGLQRDDGLVAACVFEGPQPYRGHCYILDYSALYGAVLLDYAQASGDWQTARDLWPVARQQLDIVLQYLNTDGLFVDPGNWWLFIDWQAELDKQAAIHGVLVYSVRKCAELAEAIGLTREAQALTPLVQKMTDAARRHLWDESRKLFVSGSRRQVSWASQAWMILAGVVDKQQGAAMLRAVAAHADAIQPAGPYLYHYVAEAMLLCDMEKEAVALLRDYWGGMVQRGASTFWEVYDPKRPELSPYNSHLVNSYCHAWSCTPSYFIRRSPDAFRAK